MLRPWTQGAIAPACVHSQLVDRFDSSPLPCPQYYSKTAEGWLALARVVRYHQPPGSRFYGLFVNYWEVADPAQVLEEMPILRSVFPTLTARGAYGNIYSLHVEAKDGATPLLGCLEQSHISHLWLFVVLEEIAPFADALIRLLNRGQLRKLELHADEYSFNCESDQFARVVEAICMIQPERSLTSLLVSVTEAFEVEALMALAANNATHKLQNILVDGLNAGFDVVDTGLASSGF